MSSNQNKKVGIIGSGNIGLSFAMLFSQAGYSVCIYDIVETQLNKAMGFIKDRFDSLHKEGHMKGTLTPEQATALVSTTNELSKAINGTFYIVECVPERLEMKRAVYSKIQTMLAPNTIVSSSTSALSPTALSEGFDLKNRYIVTHPCNPPFYCPAIEVVPSKYTEASVIAQTQELLKQIGLNPVLVRKDVPGFALNRMQYALLNECVNLIREGIVDVEGVDTIFRDGMGMRYAFMGPMETILLNGEGVNQYCERFGDIINAISADLEKSPTPSWSAGNENAAMIEEQIVKRIPLNTLEERKAWRDRRLAALSKLKLNLEEAGK